MYTVNSISIKKICIFMGGFIIIIFYEFKLLEKLHISCNFLWCHVNMSHLHNFVHISKSSCSGIHQGMVMTSINTSINLILRKSESKNNEDDRVHATMLTIQSRMAILKVTTIIFIIHCRVSNETMA